MISFTYAVSNPSLIPDKEHAIKVSFIFAVLPEWRLSTVDTQTVHSHHEPLPSQSPIDPLPVLSLLKLRGRMRKRVGQIIRHVLNGDGMAEHRYEPDQHLF